ncbi:hypothetical protein SAY87_004330 [Trapa incisa]|uniref:Uncharacterized protein n=1 Tax=Trapa incisa TaxID=236973 RepID=A0AAN7JS13_9MYRT|nr:hypothetical protein SAY87_004330 [Trapa incisa]
MAGDQDSFWFTGGAAISHPAPMPLHHIHSDSALYSPQTVPGGCSGFLPLGATTAISPLGEIQLELLSEQQQYVLPQSSEDWGVPSYSTPSTLINDLADAAALSAFVEEELQCDSMADPLNHGFGSSSLLADKVGFNPFEDAVLPCESVASQLTGSPLSSAVAGTANFYQPAYQRTESFSTSSVTFNGSPAISGSGKAAAAFCPSPKQEPFYNYSPTGPLIENPPAISGNDPMAAMAAAAGASKAEPSERNGLNISLIWTAEEQRLLNDLCKRYGHIECNVARLAKIARMFQGKSIRDVALRIRWMEEKTSQRTKVVNSSRAHRAMRAQTRSKDYASNNPSSQPGIPY